MTFEEALKKYEDRFVILLDIQINRELHRLNIIQENYWNSAATGAYVGTIWRYVLDRTEK